MSIAIQRPKELQKEKTETTFIICDGKENTWTLLVAESLDEAVDRAEESGLKPRYVVEEELATSIGEGKNSVEG